MKTKSIDESSNGKSEIVPFLMPFSTPPLKMETGKKEKEQKSKFWDDSPPKDYTLQGISGNGIWKTANINLFFFLLSD